MYHPDKNGNTFESTEKFKKINQSFDYLKENMFSSDEDIFYDNYSEDINEKEDIFSYKYILQLFLKSIMEGKYDDIISYISLLSETPSAISIESTNSVNPLNNLIVGSLVTITKFHLSENDSDVISVMFFISRSLKNSLIVIIELLSKYSSI
jgi:hypothetical protein